MNEAHVAAVDGDRGRGGVRIALEVHQPHARPVVSCQVSAQISRRAGSRGSDREVRVGSGITQEPEDPLRLVNGSAKAGRQRRLVPEDRASFSEDVPCFHGPIITWITATGPACGRARVIIYGRPRDVDLYRR